MRASDITAAMAAAAEMRAGGQLKQARRAQKAIEFMVVAYVDHAPSMAPSAQPGPFDDDRPLWRSTYRPWLGGGAAVMVTAAPTPIQGGGEDETARITRP